MTAALVTHAARQALIDAAIALACGDIYDAAAFLRLVAAADVYREAARRRSASVPRMPFGPKRGQPLTVLTAFELESFERYLSHALRDVERGRFRAANLELRAEVLAELHRRQRAPGYEAVAP